MAERCPITKLDALQRPLARVVLSGYGQRREDTIAVAEAVKVFAFRCLSAGAAH